MDTLNASHWDVVISGTGLPQSLLALALSRSEKKILHLDRHNHYGGDEAALSLSEAEMWTGDHAGPPGRSTSFSHAIVTKPTVEEEDEHSKLSYSRAYSLALSPQLIYTRSALLPALVSSKVHNQLDFQAVGSWFIARPSSENTSSPLQLSRVPGGREDVFQDSSLDLKGKRSLMKFLRFVINYEDQFEVWQDDRKSSFSAFLHGKFGLPPASYGPILALALSTRPRDNTTVEDALPRIASYLQGLGIFGQGFGALLPKWGGLAEIGQVACRSGAVGGGVYVLGKGIADVQPDDEFQLALQLSTGEKITTKWLVGTQQELPGSQPGEALRRLTVSKSMTIVSSPLSSLFPPTSEGGPTPAGAVVWIEPADGAQTPVYIFAHSAESGECPSGQAVLYASIAQEADAAFVQLDRAVSDLLESIAEDPSPRVLWTMKYQQDYNASLDGPQHTGPVLNLRPLSPDLLFKDDILEDVKQAWQQITNDEPDLFLKFDAREGTMVE